MKPIKTIILFMSSLATLAGCSPQEQEPLSLQRVNVLTLATPEQMTKRQFNGQVVVADMTRLSFRIDGKLTQLSVLPGQNIKKGQVLARLDNAITTQKLQDAKAQQELLERQWQRSSALLKKGLVARSEFDELTAQLRSAKVNLRAAQVQLSYTELKAPFDGIINALNKQSYETVAAGETVLTAYRTDRTDVQVDIPDTLLSRASNYRPNKEYKPTAIVTGQQQSVTLTFLEHSLMLDETHGSYFVRLSLTDPSVRLLPGEVVEINADLKQAGLPIISGFRVPLTALQSRGNAQGFRLWRMENNRVQPVLVEVVQIGQQGGLVAGNINTGDQIVTTGLSRLRAGQQVMVVDKDGQSQ